MIRLSCGLIHLYPQLALQIMCFVTTFTEIARNPKLDFFQLCMCNEVGCMNGGCGAAAGAVGEHPLPAACP